MQSIRLSPDECAYIAVCNMPPDFREISQAAKSRKSYTLDVRILSINNSMLLEAVRKGYGNGLSLLDYFEGMDDNGHNMQLFKKYKDAMALLRRMNPSAFEDVREKIDGCSVKVGHRVGQKPEVWFPSGVRRAEINMEYLPEVADEDWFTIHGAYAIRKLNGSTTTEELKRLPGIWSGVLK